MSLTPRLDRLEINKIINGNFDFWQRGTSNLIIDGTRRYSADRFNGFRATGGTGTVIDRSTDVPTEAESGYQSEHSLFVNNPTAASPGANDSMDLGYYLEGYDFADIHRKEIVLSFWTKSTEIGTYSIMLRNDANDRQYVTSYTIDVANVWEKKEIPIQLDIGGIWNIGNSAGLRIFWILSAGTNRTGASLNSWGANASEIAASGQVNLHQTNAEFRLSQVMLNEGSQAGRFNRAGKTITEELTLCQRYFEKSNNIDNGLTLDPKIYFPNINVFTTSASLMPVEYKVTKRTAPTVELRDLVGNGGPGDPRISTIATGGTSTQNVAVSGGINSRESWFTFQMGATSSFAGYYYQFAADAEL